MFSRPVCLPALAAALILPIQAGAAEQRQMNQAEIESWLDADPNRTPSDAGEGEAPLPAPPLPPRHYGWVIESTVGASSPLGALKNVSPTAPWFHLGVGYEPWRYFMLFVEGDFFIANTRFANRPPEPRTYAYYAMGGGVRLTLPFGETFGGLLEGDVGVARTGDDALVQYGYRSSDDFTVYFGGGLGLEVYPVNPHLTVQLKAGVRSYQGLVRDLSSDPSLNVMSSLAIKYAF